MAESQTELVAVIILAAGTSRRLGRPKQLLELDGVPLITHVVRRALLSSANKVVVVVGADADRVRAALNELPVEIVVNADYTTGQASSLRAGMAVVRASAGAVVVLLGDQPGIDPIVIDRVIDAHRIGGARLAMALYGEDRGHPVLFSYEFFDELDAIVGDEGGRSVLHAHPDALVFVPATSDRVPADVDTEEAWQRLLETGV